MNVLLIGYGSIGKRHEEVLLKLKNISKIDIVSNQNIPDKNIFKSLKTIKELNTYDYFIVSSETNKHYEQLVYINSKVKNKIIFCEKPLFEKYYNIDNLNNKIFVGYVLRFHPLLNKLYNLLKEEKILTININSGQYLPLWRPNTDYRKCYSAEIEKGGGVLLDLSHEIDYLQWLCGNIVDLHSYQTKISDLEIKSDDITTFIAKSSKGVIITLSIDYINKITQRKLIVNTIKNTYELDLIKNTLIIKDKDSIENISEFSNLPRNYMFELMHKSILNNDYSNVCTYEDGLEVMKTIKLIQEQNNV